MIPGRDLDKKIAVGASDSALGFYDTLQYAS